MAGFVYSCASREDGSEAVFVKDNELHIVDLGKVVGIKVDQSAIVSVEFAESIGEVNKLVGSDGSKLRVLHDWNKASLFAPSVNKLVLIEAPQKGQIVMHLTPSLNAGYVAILQCVGEGRVELAAE